MPLKGTKTRAAYQRDRRARLKSAKALASGAAAPSATADPAGELAAWSAEALRIPPGHPLAGQPLTLPQYGVDFLRDALAVPESLMSIGRKNAKSAVVAVYILGRLAGPLRFDGWRGGVCSVTREKANELRLQCEAIAEASGIEGLTFKRSPAPGHIESASGRLDILSAERSAGHASGFDDAIVDELGLLPEAARELVAGMRSSVSARGGRFMALSITGDAPFTAEILDRQGEVGLAVHHYAAPEGCDLDDVAAWHAANPGILAGIKQLSYMQHESARVLSTPADQPAFRAFDLNTPINPSRQVICDAADWRACEVDELPPRRGPCTVGFDLGSGTSMTAACCAWPESGRFEAWAAFPDTPDLRARGRADGKGAEFYAEMERRGELRTYPGRVTNVGAFLGEVAADLAGQRVIAVGADRHRKAEALQAFEAAGVRWPIEWRGTGAHAHADGSHDCRAWQRWVLSGRMKVKQSLVMRAAIAGGVLRFDGAGNPAICKAQQNARIDALSAGVIACGLADIHCPPGVKRRPAWRYVGAA